MRPRASGNLAALAVALLNWGLRITFGPALAGSSYALGLVLSGLVAVTLVGTMWWGQELVYR